MNPDFPQNEREQLEAKLTALLLGELSADEAIEMGKAMERDPQLAALYERLKVTIGLVRESAVQPAAETNAQSKPLKMSSERREKLLAQFKTVAPKEFAKPAPKVGLLLQFAAVLAILGLLAAMLLPSLAKSKSRSMSASVTANLRMLDGAKQQWALENSKSGDAAPTMEELKPYLGRGESGLPSVAGETYVPGKVSEPPTIETSVEQAKKLFGSRVVETYSSRPGRVQISLLPPGQPAQVAMLTNGVSSASTGFTSTFASSVPSQNPGVSQIIFGLNSASRPPTVAPPVPKTEIVLPAGGQRARDTSAVSGYLSGYVDTNVEWHLGTGSPNVGSPGRVNPTDASDNKFVGRYNYIGPQPGQTLEIAAIPEQAHVANTDTIQLNYAAPSDISGALARLADTNLIAGASGKFDDKVPVLEDVPVLGKLFRNESMSADANGHSYSGLTRDGVGGLRDIVSNGVAAQSASANASKSESFDWAANMTMAGPIAGSSTGEEERQAEIVLPTPLGAPADHSTIVASGGSMPSSGFGGARGSGGGVISANSWAPSTPLVWGGKQVEIAAVADSEGRRRAPKPAIDFDPTTGVPVGTAATNSVTSDQTRAYFAAKENLENEKSWRQVFAMKIGQEEMDKNPPRAKMVEIPVPATATPREKPSLGEKLRETFSGKVERTARITVEREHPDIGRVAGSTVGQAYDPYFIQTEQETIKSDAVLKKAVENLKLDGGDKSKTKAAVQQLKKDIDVITVKDAKSIDIGAKSAKPEEAARIANAVAQAYKEYRAEEYEGLKNHGIQSLQQQFAEQDQKVKLAQAKVDELRKSLGVNDYVANTSGEIYLMTAERQKELVNLRAQKEADYNRQKTLLEKLKPLDRESLKQALPIAVSDTQLNTLMSELDIAEQALIKLKLDYAPDHPKYKSTKELVDDLNRKIDDHVDGIMAGLQTKVAASKASLNQLDLEIEQVDKKAEDSPESKIHIPIPLPTPQPEILTGENGFSTFSLNVSDVSFKLAAASLEKGQMPEPASIRSEEFINAFNYRDPDAAPGVPIAFASERARYPFAHNRELLRFSLKTAAAGRQAGRPLNIVLLLDNSGSMERADRVRIIQEALRVLAAQLHPADTFSIVTFARTATLRVDGLRGDQAPAAAAEIAKLTPEGGTNLGDALDLAYETALHHYLANGDNRVVLLTDGAANLGDVNPDALKQKVEAHRKQGVALDCFGIGWEDYNDDLLEVLTRNGDGRYGFINTPEAASTEFVSQIAGALHVAASDVKVQVEFNPKRVTSYRQIGYAKHQLTKEQFRDNAVDAAEIAAQEAGNALYTIETNPQGEGSIATVRVRYKVPATGEYREQAWDVPYTGSAVALDQASPAMRLAATASAFSEWLATSPFAEQVTTDQLLQYLSGVPQVYGADKRPAKLEWMIRQARSISGK
jgi:Mg-chelatase subunit ChlD/type II secretory pathway pseudopilin PulG